MMMGESKTEKDVSERSAMGQTIDKGHHTVEHKLEENNTGPMEEEQKILSQQSAESFAVPPAAADPSVESQEKTEGIENNESESNELAEKEHDVNVTCVSTVETDTHPELVLEQHVQSFSALPADAFVEDQIEAVTDKASSHEDANDGEVSA